MEVHANFVLILKSPLLVHVVVLNVVLDQEDLMQQLVLLVLQTLTQMTQVTAKHVQSEHTHLLLEQRNVFHVLVVPPTSVVRVLIVQSINIPMVDHVFLVLQEWFQEADPVSVYLVL